MTVFALIGMSVGAPVPSASANGAAIALAVAAVADRLSVADDVAAAKWASGGSVHDQDRADDVVADAVARGSAMGLAEDRVAALFEDQIAAAEGLEYSRFADWSFQPGAPPRAGADLSDARGRIDDASRRLLRAYAAIAGGPDEPSCAAKVRTAVAEEISRRGWGEQWARGMRRATSRLCSKG